MPIFLFSQESVFIDKISIIRLNVAENDSSFLGRLMNKLHFVTREYVIRNELLFKEQSWTEVDNFDETERNLRLLKIFTSAKIGLDSIGFDQYEAIITTQDSWSTYLLPHFSSFVGYDNYGFVFDEYNLFGTSDQLQLKSIYRQESNIGWEGSVKYVGQRIPGTDLQDSLYIKANKIRTLQKFNLISPFRTLSTRYSYGLNFVNSFGRDFVFRSTIDYDLIKSNYTTFDLWYSHSWWKYDKLFITAKLTLNKAERENEKYRQAFDNSGILLFNIASLSQEFDVVDNINSFQIEDINTGGYGSVSIGKIFPIASGGDNLYYISGYAEKSFLGDRYYLYLSVGGGSGFSQYSAPKYTYQESSIIYYVKIFPKLLFTGRINQENVWNWPSWRQLILDSENGLRGYDLNGMQGENRLFYNAEFRYFVDYELLYFKPSFVLFFDIGSIWRQDKKIYDAIFHKSLGGGVRFHFVKSLNPNHTLRIDFPYNLTTKKVGLIVSYKQFFSSFKQHLFSLPYLFGNKIDSE